jgi:hypothetical protein
VVKPLGEYLGGVLLGPLTSFSSFWKAARIISGGLKLLGFTMQLKVLIHSPQLKMVQQQLLHLQLHKVNGYSTKTSTKTQLDYQK